MSLIWKWAILTSLNERRRIDGKEMTQVSSVVWKLRSGIRLSLQFSLCKLSARESLNYNDEHMMVGTINGFRKMKLQSFKILESSLDYHLNVKYQTRSS